MPTMIEATQALSNVDNNFFFALLTMVGVANFLLAITTFGIEFENCFPSR